MPFEEVKKLWMNGRLVDFADAKIHVLSHVIHYGSGVFEGVRCYKTKNGSAIFRLREHTRRIYDSAKIYRMAIPYTVEEFNQACIDIILANGFESCYLRPLVYRGFHSLGVFPGNCPVDVCIAAWEWGKYLGKEALELGVDVRVASWERMAPNTFPAMAKATGNYLNSQLIRLEADADGYSEGIALDVRGYVSEGSGENIFIVRNNIIYTPTLGASVLPGITRDSILTIARDLGFEAIEQDIPREFLYVADEVRRGPVTEKIQSEFFAYIAGEVEDRYNCLTPVVGAKKVAMAAT